MVLHYMEGHTLNFVFDGELDQHCASEVRNALDNVLEKGNFAEVVFDFEKLRFMDSTGIGVLLGRYKKLNGKRISMAIRNPNNTIDKILRLSGIYEIIPKLN